MDWSEYFGKHTIWQIPHAFHENIDILLLFIFTTTIFCFIHRLRTFDFCCVSNTSRGNDVVCVMQNDSI